LSVGFSTFHKEVVAHPRNSSSVSSLPKPMPVRNAPPWPALDSCVWLLVPRCPGPAAPLLHPPEGPGSENLILVPMPKQPTGTPSEKPPAPSVQEKTGPVPFHRGRPKPIPIVRVEAEGRRFNAVLAPFGSAPYRTCPGEHGTRRTALGGGQAGEVGYARAPGRSLKESVTLGQRDALPACLPDARYGTWLCFG
jgi:hypothetical protein